ncbi:MAG: hypothetical protein QOF68_2897, partial [Gaiellales bacterium]|nr:hypothetical protein [Gaiellales bacterium]
MAARLGRGRRLAVYSLVVIASALVVLGVLATWLNRVALDNETYTDASSELLQQPEVQHALSIYLVDELYANVDVAAQIQPLLPPQAQGLAGPASALLRDYAQRSAERLLQSDAIQQTWK